MNDIFSVLLDTQIVNTDNKTNKSDDVSVVDSTDNINNKNESITEIIKTQTIIPEVVNSNSLSGRDYISELQQKLINDQINRLVNSKPKRKKIFSATDLSQCPKFVWYKLKGLITKEMIDTNNLFYLLDLYAEIGNTVHKYIYKKLNFESTEKYIVDEKNHISGRYDIYDNETIIDIKSSMILSDVSPQLSVYYYLHHIYNSKPVRHVKVWWVLQNRIVEYSINDIEKIYPIYLDRANKLADSFKYKSYPEKLLGADKNKCNFCPIKSWCESTSNNTNNSSVITDNNENKNKSDKDIVKHDSNDKKTNVEKIEDSKKEEKTKNDIIMLL